MFEFSKKPKQKNDEALKLFQQAKEDALRCLHNEEFKAFVNSFRIAEDAIINRLMRYAQEEADPIKFAFGAKDLLNKLESLRVLINSVHTNAGERYARK